MRPTQAQFLSLLLSQWEEVESGKNTPLIPFLQLLPGAPHQDLVRLHVLPQSNAAGASGLASGLDEHKNDLREW